MKSRHIAAAYLALAIFAVVRPAMAGVDEFSFGVIAPSLRANADDAVLRQSISETDDDNLAFVVVNGIKSAQESCNDAVYLDRKILFDGAKNGLIVSLAGADWTGCHTSAGRSAAQERLNRLRELFFSEDFSFGSSKIPLTRQSNAPKFRSYAENARWEFGPVLFATLNLPADNNHYLLAAGRNSEFEDRSVANHDWLQRLVMIAMHRKLSAVVLFCDSDPMISSGSGVRRDGYVELRSQLEQLARRFAGRILVIHDMSPSVAGVPRPGTPAEIIWRGNLGSLGVASGWVKLTVAPGTPGLLSLSSPLDSAVSPHGGNKKAAAVK